MKMAKATRNEIEQVIRLSHLTEAVCRPKNFESSEFPTDTGRAEYFDENDPKDLRKFYERVKELSSGLMRVAFGYQVLVDSICNPSETVLAWKPGVVVPEEKTRL